MSYVTIAKIQKTETTFTSVDEAVTDLYSVLTEEIKSKLSQLKTDGKIVDEKFEIVSDDNSILIHTRTFLNKECFIEYVSTPEFNIGKDQLTEKGWTIFLMEQKEDI